MIPLFLRTREVAQNSLQPQVGSSLHVASF